MMRIAMDLEFTGLHKNTTPVSIGLVTQKKQMFYAEFSDYDKTQIDSWLLKNVIENLVMNPPEEQEEPFSWREDKSFTWGKDKNVMLRDTKDKIAEYLADWFQDLLGGPMNWVEYSGHERPEVVKKKSISIVADCCQFDWVVFSDIFGTAWDIPSCVCPIPEDIYTYLLSMGYSPADAFDVDREKLADTENNPIVLPEFWFPDDKSRKHNSLYDACLVEAAYGNIQKALRIGG